jgi:predicted nucleic acid-binding protein
MDARRVLDLLSHAELVEVADIPPVSRNPKDDIFLATAVVGEAEVPRDQDCGCCHVSEDPYGRQVALRYRE